jgi:hypothetical protein
MMKNKKDFIKLFDLNIPNIDHFDYYLSQLSKTDKFSDIYYLMELFEKADQIIDDFYDFKITKANEIVNFIKSSNTYTELTLDKNQFDYPVSKSIHYDEDKIYLSVDLKSANWISLKKFDQQNELGDSYEGFLNKFNMPKVFSKSKYLRQFIFGNVNPKKQQKIQRNIIQSEIVRRFDTQFQIEGVKNDEVIFSINTFEESNDIIRNIDNNRFHSKIFKINRVEDFRIFNYYNENGEFIKKDIVGCSGHQFYWKLKEHITGEKIDIRDLFFKSEGKIAIWNHPDLLINLK